MTAPTDQHYFHWSTSANQQLQPLINHTHRRQYSFEEKQLKGNSTSTTHPRKKQKLNEHQSQSYYPFQAELTQKIDIECGSNTNGYGPTTHPPTHHFTLSTVINLSVNGQTPKSQQSYPIKSSDLSTLIPYSEGNFSSYLKDLDLSTLDLFVLPSCPNPSDYLTVDGLLTFLMSDRNQFRHSSSSYPTQQIYNHPQIPLYRQSSHPQYSMLQTYSSSQDTSTLTESLSSRYYPTATR